MLLDAQQQPICEQQSKLAELAEYFDVKSAAGDIGPLEISDKRGNFKRIEVVQPGDNLPAEPDEPQLEPLGIPAAP
ncbi:MAG TPA: hypothetical protein VFI31_08725 [Pirellulales bacterium]|nr:hypothetical protein [Pirellulales bacterium]